MTSKSTSFEILQNHCSQEIKNHNEKLPPWYSVRGSSSPVACFDSLSGREMTRQRNMVEEKRRASASDVYQGLCRRVLCCLRLFACPPLGGIVGLPLLSPSRRPSAPWSNGSSRLRSCVGRHVVLHTSGENVALFACIYIYTRSRDSRARNFDDWSSSFL